MKCPRDNVELEMVDEGMTIQIRMKITCEDVEE